MENVLREVFSSWLARELPSLIERDYSLELSDRIVTIIGPRRAGKTYFMFQIAKKLMEKGFSKQNIAFIDFEDVRLQALRPVNYSAFVKTLHEVFTRKDGKIVLLLDEVQNLRDWERWVRTLHNSQNYYIIVSGSSSKLSSKEVSTKLRGRCVSKLILPLSFKEFLKFKNVKIQHLDAPETRGELLQKLREFMDFGGFPEVVNSKEGKVELLRTYRETIFYRDVVERFRVRDISSLDTFVRLLMENFGKYVSISKLSKYFRSLGLKKSKKTLANYLKYLEIAFFVFTVEKFGYKTRERVLQPKKVYPIDLGFYRLTPRFTTEYGRLMESLVAIELFKKSFQEEFELFYWKDYQGREVDFIIKEGLNIRQLIQVTYASDRNDVEEREIKALVKASEDLKCNDLLIITWDYKGEEAVGRKKIRFIPLYEWLLHSPETKIA
ncbi:MAG: ATP-binding protein [Thermoproteota archaeon]